MKNLQFLLENTGIFSSICYNITTIYRGGQFIKKVLSIIAALSLVLVAAGCGNSGESSESKSEKAERQKVEDTVEIDETKLDFPDKKVFGDETAVELKVLVPASAAKLTNSQVKAFAKQYPDVIKDISVYIQDGTDTPSEALKDVENSADVFNFSGANFADHLDAGVLAPVSEEFLNDAMQYNYGDTVENATARSTMYAYPEDGGDTYCLVYDKTVVSDEDATTLEGVLKACKKAGRHFVMDIGNGYYACTFAFTGGMTPRSIGDDGKTQLFNEYNEEEVVDSLMAFAKLMKEYKGTFISDVSEQISARLNSKTAAAGIDFCRNLNADKLALKDDLGVAKLPTVNINGNDTQMISVRDSYYLGVNSGSSYPKAAQALAYFLSSEGCQYQRMETLGWVPSHMMVLQEAKDYPSVTAVCRQLNYSVSRKVISDELWMPMGELGKSLYNDESYAENKDKAQTLLQTTVSAVM